MGTRARNALAHCTAQENRTWWKLAFPMAEAYKHEEVQRGAVK